MPDRNHEVVNLARLPLKLARLPMGIPYGGWRKSF
jgi:hypothetical protein